MPEGIYVGVDKDVPVYADKIITIPSINSTNLAEYFTVETAEYAEAQQDKFYCALNVANSSVSQSNYIIKCIKDIKLTMNIYTDTTQYQNALTIYLAASQLYYSYNATTNVVTVDLKVNDRLTFYFWRYTIPGPADEECYILATASYTEKELVGYEKRGVARKVNKGYLGKADVAKQIMKGYVGVNDVARLFYFYYIPVETLTLDKTFISDTISDYTYTITATVLPANASDKVVEWSLSKPDIVEIIEKTPYTCTIRQKNVGYVSLKATIGGKMATCYIYVNAIEEVETVSLKLYDIVISCEPSASRSKTDAYVSWTPYNAVIRSSSVSVSDNTKASVVFKGTNYRTITVTGLSPGDVDVTVELSGKTATSRLKVVDKLISTGILSIYPIELTVGVEKELLVITNDTGITRHYYIMISTMKTGSGKYIKNAPIKMYTDNNGVIKENLIDSDKFVYTIEGSDTIRLLARPEGTLLNETNLSVDITMYYYID